MAMARLVISYVALLSLIDLSVACTGVTVLRKVIGCQVKRKILDTHNKLRQKVAVGNQTGQPSAINMLEMMWDDKIALGAQKWADNCTFKHNTYADRNDTRFYVGQNLAISWSSSEPDTKRKPEFEKRIQNWYDEVQYYKGYFTPQVGHYTQVVWANTYMIGCGYVYYNNINYTKLYVCDYGPAGNIAGQKPYVSGRGCNKTELTNSTQYPGLCPGRKNSAKVVGNRRLNRFIAYLNLKYPESKLDTIDGKNIPACLKHWTTDFKEKNCKAIKKKK